MAIDFVKFIRGNEESYQRLLNNNTTDKNTLYFIYDKNSTAANPTGKLYLDKFLIGGNSDELRVQNLTDLLDTEIGTLTGDEFLRYDKSVGKWKPILAADFIDELQLNSLKPTILSDIIKQDDELDIDALQRTNPNPKNGDISFVDGTIYLFNNSQWIKTVDSSIRGSNLQTLLNKINNTYTKEEIDNLNFLTYKTVGNLEDIDFDEDKNKLLFVQKNSNNSELIDQYDEYMVLNGALEKIGGSSIDLSNFVTLDSDRLLTEEQKNKLDHLVIEDGQIEISGNVNAENVIGLSDAISENQFIKSVDNNIFNVTSSGKLELKSDFVTTAVFNSTIGNLDNIINRISESSTIVDELNQLKENLIWSEIE